MSTKKTVVNPFDAIAVPVKTVKSKTTKLTASVTNEIKITVDNYIAKKASLKQIEAQVEEYGEAIINHVRPQQEEQARAGNYSKSFDVAGVTGSLTYTTTDKFSTPKDPEAQAQLKSLLGNKFDELFKVKRTITLKPGMQEDNAFLQKFAKALMDAGIDIRETFDVVDVLESKEDLDKKQFDLTPSKLEVFKTLVRQNKPSLK